MLSWKKSKTEENSSVTVNSGVKTELKNKSFMLILSIVLLVAAAVFFAYAWFTRMASISSLEFDVAQWDMRANYQSGELKVKVKNYDYLNTDKAAPGTEGYIPVKISATQSDTDIIYTINATGSSLSEEFQKRLMFFYRNGDTSEDYRVGYDKVTGTYAAPYTADTLIKFNGTDHILSGTLKRGKTESIKFYWRWVYDAAEALEEGLIPSPEDIGITGMSNEDWVTFKAAVKTGTWPTDEAGSTKWAGYKAAWETYYEAWDDFDLQVGKYPDAFEKDMRALVNVSGVQIESDISQHTNS